MCSMDTLAGPTVVRIAGGAARGPDGLRNHARVTDDLRQRGIHYVLDDGALPLDRPETQALLSLAAHLAGPPPHPDRAAEIADAAARWALPLADRCQLSLMLTQPITALSAAGLLRELVAICLPATDDPGLRLDLRRLQDAVDRADDPGGVPEPPAALLLRVLRRVDELGTDAASAASLPPTVVRVRTA
jgi:hypothetical protein